METPTAGIDICRKIMKAYPCTKIIILTCHEDEEVILSAYEAGAVDYVLKEGSSSEISEAIRAAYNNSSPIRSYAASAVRKQMMDLVPLQVDFLIFIYYCEYSGVIVKYY